MKLLILGGSGTTGRHLVNQALAKGHEVTVLVRDSSRAALSHPQLKLVQGQATEGAALEKVVAGQEAVLSTLGPRAKGDPICALAASALVGAMTKHGVQRLVWLSAGGVGDSAPQLIDASFVFGRLIMPLFLKTPYASHARAEETIRASGLRWTVVRPVELTNRPTGRKATAVPIGPAKVVNLKVGREEVAAFMLEALTDPATFAQMPILQG